MNELTALALRNVSIGDMCLAIQERIAHNVEIKIKPQWIRVQHIHHRDRLLSARAINEALVQTS